MIVYEWNLRVDLSPSRRMNALLVPGKEMLFRITEFVFDGSATKTALRRKKVPEAAHTVIPPDLRSRSFAIELATPIPDLLYVPPPHEKAQSLLDVLEKLAGMIVRSLR